MKKDNDLENTNAPKKTSRFKETMHKVRWKNIHEINMDNDIKYHGPFSYRHLRIFAWFFLIVACIGMLINFGSAINPNLERYSTLANVFSLGRSLMTPLFLIAAFSVVLVAKNGYRRLILMYSGFAILIYLAFIIVHQHFFVGIVEAITGSRSEANKTVDNIIALANSDGFINFNIFIDLLLCSLVTFFINYTPTRFFQGKKLYIFRSFVIFPILYEIASIVLKILSAGEIIKLSVFIFPLLTTKTPASFLIFLAMAIFIKRRERHFLKHGKTHADYEEFKKTNINSLHFSLSLSAVIILAVILDLLVFGLSALIIALNAPSGVGSNEFIESQLNIVFNIGIGQSFTMIFIIPIVLLFDYRRTYDNIIPDILIIAFGTLFLIIAFIEGGFEVIRFALIDNRSSRSDSEGISESLSYIKNVLLNIRGITI